MSGTRRTQRIIAFIIFVSPWIYIPSAFKEVGFIILAILLYLSTVDVRKKREKEMLEERTSSASTMEHTSSPLA